MSRILVIPYSDFSRNRIVKVDIKKQVEIENTVDNQTLTSYSSSTVSDNNLSFKNNDQ